MSYCYICGDEQDLIFRRDILRYACKYCSAETPHKISREEFDKRYWGDDDTVPASTKREFYDDYRASGDTFEEYVKATVGE